MSGALLQLCYRTGSTEIQFRASNTLTMRFAVASVMALMLLSILTVCPLMACGPVLDSRCCHPSPTSCPETRVQKCPYLLLENGKTTTVAAHILNAALDPVSPEAGVSDADTFIGNDSRIPSSYGLYLRIRVLLI